MNPRCRRENSMTSIAGQLITGAIFEFLEMHARYVTADEILERVLGKCSGCV